MHPKIKFWKLKITNYSLKKTLSKLLSLKKLKLLSQNLSLKNTFSSLFLEKRTVSKKTASKFFPKSTFSNLLPQEKHFQILKISIRINRINLKVISNMSNHIFFLFRCIFTLFKIIGDKTFYCFKEWNLHWLLLNKYG